MLDNLHIRLFEARAITIDHRWDTQNVQSTFWRFYRNGHDGAFLRLVDGDYPLHGGRLYFVPAGVRFSCGNTQAVEHFYVHFDVIGLSSLATRALFRAPICLPDAAALTDSVDALARTLGTLAGDDLAMQCRVKAIVLEGLALSLESLPVEEREQCWREAAALEPVSAALRHIEENLPAPMTNRSLAALCCLSEDYFIQRFRECVGQTPTQFIRERRVTLAAQRLLFTTESIERIAAETGFGNRFYFARVFARHTGVSPAAYRKAARV